jgi:hypothetical protein
MLLGTNQSRRVSSVELDQNLFPLTKGSLKGLCYKNRKDTTQHTGHALFELGHVDPRQ